MRIGNIGGCLGELLDEPVACPADCIGDKVEAQVRSNSLHPACACVMCTLYSSTYMTWNMCPGVGPTPQVVTLFSHLSRFVASCIAAGRGVIVYTCPYHQLHMPANQTNLKSKK